MVTKVYKQISWIKGRKFIFDVIGVLFLKFKRPQSIFAALSNAVYHKDYL